MGSMALVYRLWCVRLGIPLYYLQGICIFFMGLAFILPAVMDRSRISMLGLAIPLILCGLAIPLLKVSAVALFGCALAMGCLFMAAIQSWQLRAQPERQGHGAD